MDNGTSHGSKNIKLDAPRNIASGTSPTAAVYTEHGTGMPGMPSPRKQSNTGRQTMTTT